MGHLGIKNVFYKEKMGFFGIGIPRFTQSRKKLHEQRAMDGSLIGMTRCFQQRGGSSLKRDAFFKNNDRYFWNIHRFIIFYVYEPFLRDTKSNSKNTIHNPWS